MKIIIRALCAVLLLHAQYSIAQNNLSGIITNATTKLPLSRVTVYIPELERTTLSDDKGVYAFSNLPSSTLRIQFSLIGYETTIQTIEPNKSPTLHVQLRVSYSELQEVTVTSSNTNLASNIPFAVTTISQQELRQHASPTVMGSLSYLPGVDRISVGTGIGKPVIRGLSFNRILLYTQGTRIQNQQWDDRHDLGVSDVGVEKIEVVKGPAALIYGADALGGALIFADEKPAPAGSTLGDANLGFYSNTLGITADAGVRSTNKNGFFYGIRAGVQTHTSYVQGEDEEKKPANEKEEEEFAFNSKFMNYVVKANAGISKKWGVSKLSWSMFRQQTGIIEDEGEEAGAADPDAEEKEQREREIEAPYQDVTTNIIGLENTFFTGHSKLNLNLGYQLNNRKEFEPLSNKEKELAIGLKLNVFTYDIKWTSDANKPLGFTIGSQGTFLTNRNFGKESLVPEADEHDIAGYGLVRYDTKKWNFLAGVRFDAREIEAESFEENGGVEEDTFVMLHTTDTIDHPEADFKRDYSPMSFSLGAAYHVNDQLTLKLNAASGFTAPNYAQLATFGKHEGTFRFERGEETLKMEQNIEGDLGLEWNGDNVGITLNGFVNHIKDYIFIYNTGDSIVKIHPDGRDSLPVYDYAQHDATLTGGEISLDIHPTSARWFDAGLSYSLIRGKLSGGGNLPYIPANKFIGEVRFRKDKIGRLTDNYIGITVSNYAKQNNVSTYELSTDGYTLLDASIGTSFKLGKQKADVRVFCTNLLNTAYYNQLSLVKYIGVRDMGRNIGIQLHFPFGK